MPRGVSISCPFLSILRQRLIFPLYLYSLAETINVYIDIARNLYIYIYIAKRLGIQRASLRMRLGLWSLAIPTVQAPFL